MASESLTIYLNGLFVPEQDAKISIFDQGFARGDAVFDAARTFQGKLFQIEEHVDRLLRSCHMLALEPGLSREKLIEVSHEVAKRNENLLEKYGDFWIMQHVTRGSDREGLPKNPSLVVSAVPLPFKARAAYYRDGLPIIIPSVRRTPPWAMSPRAKTHDYMNFIQAGLETKALDSKAWPILLDENGNLAEGSGSNIFVVKGGEIFTPEERYVLPGITRANIFSLAKKLGISCREKAVDLYDARNADELFATSTSLCVCGISKLNGRPVPYPGPVTVRLMIAFNEMVGLDIAEQYLTRA